MIEGLFPVARVIVLVEMAAEDGFHFHGDDLGGSDGHLDRVQDGVDQTAKAGAGLEHSGAGFQSEQGRKLGGDWHGRLEELIGADCNGRGVTVCDYCDGDRSFETQSGESCPNCGGRGQAVCSACSGTGKVEDE